MDRERVDLGVKGREGRGGKEREVGPGVSDGDSAWAFLNTLPVLSNH